MKSDKNIPDWNKDGIWQNVEHKLHQKKKRRTLIWWLTGTVGTAFFFGLLWNASISDSQKSTIKNDVIIIEENNNLKNTLNSSDKHKTIAQNNDTQKEQIATAFNNKRQFNIKTESTKNNTSIFNKIKSNYKEESKLLKLSNPLEVHTTSKNLTFSSADNGIDNKVKYFKNDSAPILPSIDFLMPLEEQPYSLSHPITYSTAKIDVRNTRHILLWTENGISTGTKTTSVDNELLLGDETTGQFRFIHTSAIGIQKVMKNNFSVKIGLAYQTIYEKYEYTSQSQEEDEVFVDEAIKYELPNGLTYSEPGIASQITTKSRFIIHNNFTHRLSAPIELAYSLKNNNWALELGIGSRFIFLQKFNGITTHADTHLFDQNESNNIYFSKNISLGLVTSLNLKYNISDKGSIGIGVRYEKDDFLGLIQNDFFNRYETVGLHFGYYHSL